MIYKYNRISGIPDGSYYLEHILCFGDFECPFESEILCYSHSRELLETMCIAKKWRLDGDWNEYYIRKAPDIQEVEVYL